MEQCDSEGSGQAVSGLPPRRFEGKLQNELRGNVIPSPTLVGRRNLSQLNKCRLAASLHRAESLFEYVVVINLCDL